MGDRHFSSRRVIHWRFNVLDKGSRTMNIQNLQPIADAEERLVVLVGVAQQKFVDFITRQVSIGGIRVSSGSVFFRKHVGAAAREQNGIATSN